ncbi:MAG: hypothetical protein V4559_11470 [Pseudomonadota bacterium]
MAFYAIRTPSLRNIAFTGPHMHDGSVKNPPPCIRRHVGATASLPDDAALRNMTLNEAGEASLEMARRTISTASP